MGLSTQDLTDIRNVMLDAIDIAVNPRLDRLESGMERLEGRMDGLEGRMDGLEGRMGNLQRQQSETNQRLGSIETKLKTIDGRLQAVENDITELYALTSKQTSVDLSNTAYKSLSDTEKILILHKELAAIAKHKNISLPSL
jgi:chromosome segregation ATPase